MQELLEKVLKLYAHTLLSQGCNQQLRQSRLQKNWEKTIINYKESLIFALLGYLKINGKVNCLGSVTGASNDHSSGDIYG